MPIVTITLNPAVDLHANLAILNINRVNRVISNNEVAGGKGINVATVLSLLGKKTQASGWIGLSNRHVFDDHFNAFSVEDKFINVIGKTRCNIKLVEQNEQVTELNFPGFNIDSTNIKQLLNYCGEIESPSIVVVAGSLPTSVNQDFYCIVINKLKELGHIVFFDSSGEAFGHGVNSGPYLVKPNIDELQEWYGQPITSFEDKQRVVKKLFEHGIEHILLSEGDQGVLWFSKQQVLQVNAPKVTLKSTVGAGDTLLAAFVFALTEYPNDAKQQLAFASACAALSVTDQGVGHINFPNVVALQQECKVMKC